MNLSVNVLIESFSSRVSFMLSLSFLNASDILNFEANNIIFATGSIWRKDGVGSSNSYPISLSKFNVYSPDEIINIPHSKYTSHLPEKIIKK